MSQEQKIKDLEEKLRISEQRVELFLSGPPCIHAVLSQRLEDVKLFSAGLRLSSSTSSVSLNPAVNRHYPDSIFPWPNFVREAKNFRFANEEIKFVSGDKKRLVSGIDQYSSESDIHFAFGRNIGEVLTAMKVFPNTNYLSRGAVGDEVNQIIGQPDFVIVSKEDKDGKEEKEENNEKEEKKKKDCRATTEVKIPEVIECLPLACTDFPNFWKEMNMTTAEKQLWRQRTAGHKEHLDSVSSGYVDADANDHDYIDGEETSRKRKSAKKKKKQKN